MIQQKKRVWCQLGLLVIVVVLSGLFTLESDDCYFFYWSFDSWKDFLLTKPNTQIATIVGIPQNGRYLGNLLGVVLAKCYESMWFPVRMVYYSGCLILLAYMGGRLLGGRAHWQKNGFFLLCLLVLAPRSIWQEVYSWGAAYVNYVTPVMLLLVLLVLQKEIETWTAAKLVGVFVLSVAGCLFMETNSILQVMVSALLLVCAWMVQPKRRAGSVALCLGSVTGMAMMFLSSGYGAVGSDGLREFGVSMLGVNLAKILVGTLVRPTIAALLVTGLLIWHLKKQGGSVWLWCTVAALPIHLFCVFDGLWDLYWAGDTVILEVPTVAQTVAGVALAVLWLIMLCLWQGGKAKWVTAGLAVVLVVCHAPLLVISLNGNRNFFTGYVVLALVVLVLYQKARELGLKEMNWLKGVALVVSCGLVFVYGVNAVVYTQRLDYARGQVQQGVTQMELPLVPFPGFARNEQQWKGDISYQVYERIPWDVSFYFVPYEQWARTSLLF